MSRVVVLCGAALLAACAQSGDQAGGGDGQAAPAAISLADVAGTWNVETAAMGSDSVLLTSQLVATNSMEGWQLVLPRGDTVPVRVLSVDGDSIVSEMGPFPSALREGVMVTTQMVSRMRDGIMVSRLTAHYQTGDADSVVTLRSRGTRVQ